MVRFQETCYVILSLLVFFTSRTARAVGDYDIGTPTLDSIWIDPVNGQDRPDRGSTRALAYKTIHTAWATIPPGELTNTGYVFKLAPGTYTTDNISSELSQVTGTADNPIIFQAADDTGSVNFASVDITTCKYIYFIGINVIHTSASEGSYAIKFRACDHILLRHCRFFGADSTSTDTAIAGAAFEQCRNIYLENSEIGTISQSPDFNPSGIAFDAYASQYGHIKNCLIHHFGGDGIVLRGGSAYFSIEENFISYGGGSGIQLYVRDTTKGLDNMVPPWFHYEAYDIKCVNNVIHHISGAGFSCSGGFNILFAFNTLYEIGQNSSLAIFSQARRGTSVDRQTAQQYLDSGAWGTSYWYTSAQDSDSAPIPNKNIYVYNNVFANPDDSETVGPHFIFAGPFTTAAVNAGGPRPSLADDNLQIKGNIIWNGRPLDKVLGINATSGCQPSNPTCNEAQLFSDNIINGAQPEFVDTAYANFRPYPGSTIFTNGPARAFPIPNFTWTAGLPANAKEPPGDNSNAVAFDIDSNLRNPSVIIPGAFIRSISSVEENPVASVAMQAFPNPSYGESAIRFHLEEGARVTLEVYNILGKKITTLVSSWLEAGDHIAIWDAAPVDAGTYFCRLSINGITMTKQITIIK